jgi:hypothetical protein
MRAPHRARHPSAVPHRANIPYRGAQTRNAGRTHPRRAVRDRAALERDGPVKHAHHATALRTSRRSHAHCNRPTHPVRRHAPHVRITALAPHAPLLRCRISPRCRTARFPCPWRARRRSTAHKRIAPPLGRRNSPAFAQSSSARATHQQRTKQQRRCGTAARRPWNARRCNGSRCNGSRCNARRRIMQRAPKHASFRFGTLATQCVTSAGASCPARAVCNTPRHDGIAQDYKKVLTRSTPAPCAAHRTPLTAACVRRTVRAIHRPCRTAPAHHTTARGRATRARRTHRRAVRDRAALERDGAIVHVHHAAVVALRTSRRSDAHCNRPTHPVRRHPPQLSIAALAPHAPLLWCRISPRCRTARCLCPCRARRRNPAHERIAPRLGHRKSPAFARSIRARAPDTTKRTARPCAAGRLRGCNMHNKPMQNKPMQRAPMQRTPMHRCNTHRCRPLAAACVRRTVRAIHRPCRTAPAHHTAARGRATRARRTHPHRRAVRDRAALERHGPIVHVHHATAVLRTRRRSHAHCNRPSHPVADTRSPLRIAALAQHAP